MSGEQVGLTQSQLESLVPPILDGVKTQVSALVKPIAERQAALEQRLSDLSKPVMQAASLWGGGAPAIRQGEDPLGSRGYSLLKLAGLMQGILHPSHCKLELDLSQRLHQAFVQQGGLPLVHEGKSFLVPLGSQHIHFLDGTLADEVRQCMTAGVHGADISEASHVVRQRMPGAYTQTLSQFDDAAGGALLGGQVVGELIELIRTREVFSQAGAREITLPPNGRLSYPKQTGASTAYWVGEGEQITASEQSTAYVHLLAKKLAVLVKSPNELIRFASPSIEAFFRADMARSLALKADKDMIDAVGSTLSVKGLLRYSGIQAHVASTVATDGDTFEPEDVTGMLSKLAEADYDESMAVFVMRPKMLYNIVERRAAAVASGDKEGPYLFSMNRDDITKGNPARLRGARVVTSTQVPQNRVKGSGTDLTTVILGLFEHWLIGRVGVLEFASTSVSDTAFQNDQTWLRIIQHIDSAPRHENAFVLCDDVDPDLPA